MAETVQKKSSGMKFAEQQLLRHGWQQGKGLGREEDGISEAIKVKVKCDKGGVGHRQGEQFTFHWWDHVFNKASSSLEVESDQNGVKMKKLVEEEEDGMISNKKPRKASLAKEKLYGCFVKSATLLSGQEQPEQKSSSDDSSSSDDDDQRLDLSSTTKLTDADLLKACGGRTAHKGARHGLTMSAKLARLEQQEQEFMMKYGNGKRNKPASQTTEVEEEPAEEIRITKAKKKVEKEVKEDKTTDASIIGSTEVDISLKKNKKKSSKRDTGDVIEICAPRQQPTTLEHEADNAQKTRRKRSKRKKVVEEDDCHLNGEANETIATPQRPETAEVMEAVMEESLTERKIEAESNSKKKKKKKKSSKSGRETTVAEETADSTEMENQTRSVEDEFPKKKRTRDTAPEEKREKPETAEEEPKIKRKKKKCKETRELELAPLKKR